LLETNVRNGLLDQTSLDAIVIRKAPRQAEIARGQTAARLVAQNYSRGDARLGPAGIASHTGATVAFARVISNFIVGRRGTQFFGLP
jgi:hypothetical protein